MRFLPQTIDSAGGGISNFPLTDEVHSEYFTKILEEELGSETISEFEFYGKVKFVPITEYVEEQNAYALINGGATLVRLTANNSLRIKQSTNPYIKSTVSISVRSKKNEKASFITCCPTLSSERHCCGTVYMGSLGSSGPIYYAVSESSTNPLYLKLQKRKDITEKIKEVIQLYAVELGLMGHGALYLTDLKELEELNYPLIKKIAKEYGSCIYYPNPKYGSTDLERLGHYVITAPALIKAYKEANIKLRYA